MNTLQLRSILGYVTFSVKGDQLAAFFHRCSQEQLLLWDITLVNKKEAEAKVYATEFKKLTTLAEQLNFEITIKKRHGLSFYFLILWNEKHKLVAMAFASLLLFFLANTVWNIHISGVPTHLETKITEQLKENGVYRGAFRASRTPVETIEGNIMESVPELLYISVKKRGTIYTIEAVEKKEEKLKERTSPTNLIAQKSGVIKKMLIKEGQAVVNVNDFVKKGEVLVKGNMNLSESPDDEDEETEETIDELVTSEGDIYANTWYEVTVSSNLYTSLEQLQGDKITHYYVNFGKLRIPIFIWPKIKYEQVEVINEQIPIQILKRKLPITIIKQTTYDKNTIEIVRSQEEAKEMGVEHALEDLQNKLGTDAEIIKYYILHEAVDNGKVKLRLYVSALENIAHAVPIN